MFAILILLGFVAVACGGDGGAASIDGSWVLVSGEVDGAAVTLIEGRDVTMDIDRTDVSGIAACNGYSGTVSIGDDGSFAVRELSWTEIGCEPDVMELEQSFLGSLSTVSSYEVVDGQLTISGADSTWTFESLDRS